jgi:hypothetical protein
MKKERKTAIMMLASEFDSFLQVPLWTLSTDKGNIFSLKPNAKSQ